MAAQVLVAGELGGTVGAGDATVTRCLQLGITATIATDGLDVAVEGNVLAEYLAAFGAL